MLSTVNIKHCPTKDDIEYHKIRSITIFTSVSIFVHDFMETGDETTSYDCDYFTDSWDFALVLGMCGTSYFNTNTAVVYNRSDGVSRPSIGFVNKKIRYSRLIEEKAKAEEKLSRMETGSDKYLKMLDKIKTLTESIEKYKPVSV